MTFESSLNGRFGENRVLVLPLNWRKSSRRGRMAACLLQALVNRARWWSEGERADVCWEVGGERPLGLINGSVFSVMQWKLTAQFANIYFLSACQLQPGPASA